MMSKLIDPTFKYHQVTTRAWTQIALDMSDSFIIPLNVTHYAYMMKYYSRQMENKYGSKFKANGVTLGMALTMVDAYYNIHSSVQMQNLSLFLSF